MDPDPDTNGKPSGHRIVVVRPISAVNNTCARSKREVKVRPITDSGINKMRTWVISQDWSEILQAEFAHTKAEALQRMLFKKNQGDVSSKDTSSQL